LTIKLQTNLKTIGAYTESTDLIFKASKKNYSSRDTVPLNVLPLCVQLLLGPVFQCFHYFKYLELLTKLTPYKEDRDSLKQVTVFFSTSIFFYSVLDLYLLAAFEKKMFRKKIIKYYKKLNPTRRTGTVSLSSR
jgi:hypothetical protein